MMSNLSTPTPPPFCVCRYIGQHGPRVPDVPRTGFLLRWTRQDKKCTLTHVPHGPECWRGFAPAHAVLRGVGRDPYVSAPTIPASVFMVFQMMFACITPALAFGAAAERTSLGSAIVFLFVWSTLVYDIVTCWVWGPHGWLALLGVMDYAGGTPVHIASGAAAGELLLLPEITLCLNRSTDYIISVLFFFFPASDVSRICFGSWQTQGRRVQQPYPPQRLLRVPRPSASLVWMVRLQRWKRSGCQRSQRPSPDQHTHVGLRRGYDVGPHRLEPDAQVVDRRPLHWSCRRTGDHHSRSRVRQYVQLARVRFRRCRHMQLCGRVQEEIRVRRRVGFHYVGGFVGLTITGVFAERAIIGLSYNPGDVVPSGGCLDGQCIQILIQLAAIGTVSGWSFFVTYAILWIMDKIPGLHLRLRQGEEELGTDLAQMGEHAYGFTLETKNPVDSNRRRTILSFFREAPLVLEKTKEEGPEE
ncbi:hypothetical protein BC936DRAFT_145766 [Jimgerdemannia flammicorona]|uniref:Ammonium transporter AmtB-like domain-containing protein n=1 Tax=Jimgerdemannia flammicorona TaxID=994334 RepID=A0A433D944_9FUNG|nr:hypothetical protein BC936DRAFT_145766 [Jimgerdemannia flammicorona]